VIELRSARSRWAAQIVATLLVLPFAFPLAAAVRVSLSGEGWANYRAVLSRPELPGFFRNSLLIAAGTVALTYAATMLAAYAFARLHVHGREIMFYVMLAALTLPPSALIIPLFITVQRVGLLDTYWAVILPLVALSVPLNVLLARGFMASLPVEVFDAASIDGAGPWLTFRHVVLPLSRPISAVVVVWSFLAAWNEYLMPLLFLQDPAKQTITQIPQFFAAQYNSDYTKIVAGTILIALPTVAVYLLLQRFFERGITAGAVK
jgi:ABC-type glycerol-3-phosphate transport system permease component